MSWNRHVSGTTITGKIDKIINDDFLVRCCFKRVHAHHGNIDSMIDHVEQFSLALSSLRITAQLSGASASCLADLGFTAQPKPRLLFCRKKEAKNASAARQISKAEKRRQERNSQIEGGILPTQIDIEPIFLRQAAPNTVH